MRVVTDYVLHYRKQRICSMSIHCDPAWTSLQRAVQRPRSLEAEYVGNPAGFGRISFGDCLLELCRMVAAKDLHAYCPPLRGVDLYVLIKEFDEFFFLELS